jgi:membrane-associated phospholipid phosphatase
MPVTLAVLLAAVLSAVVVWALSRSPGGPDPADPEAEERWLVSWLARHPRFGARARAIDRQAIGGLMLVVALAIILVTALLVGVMFDMVDRDSGLAGWDRAVAEWGSRHATSWSTTVLDALTDLGGTALLVVVVVAVATYDVARHRNVNVALFLLVVLGGIALINNGLKWLVDRERPDVDHLVGISGSSFPSGHSAAAAATWFALALVITRAWSRRRRAVAAGLAALISVTVAASRALLGVHWLTDVIAGTVLGWGWFLLTALVFGGRWQRLGDPAARAAARAPAQSTESAATVSVGRPSSSGSARSSTMRASRSRSSRRQM